MSLESVLGQSHAVGMLRAALESGEIHHAYLFTGPTGVGKELAAVEFARALICQEEPNLGCGKCSACLRVAKHAHPDVLWLMAEDEMIARGLAGRSDFASTPSREIKVEQIRWFQERIGLRALEGTRKVAIVVAAEEMNPQAQNAVLKTLEEPPADTVLILLTSAADHLLPTVRSRCSKVGFVPLPAALIAEEVQRKRNLDPETSSLLAVLSGGSLSRALSFDAKRLADRKELIELFEKACTSVPALLKFAETFGANRAQAEAALEVLDLWIRDLLVRQEGGDLLNRDLDQIAASASPKYSPARLHLMHQALRRAREWITERNGAPRFQLERMLIEMSGSHEHRA